TEIAFVDQLADALFAQVVITLVHRDLIDPGEQRAAKVEAADGKINLRENLPRDVLGVVPIAQNAEEDGEDLGLVALHDFAEGDFVASLHAPDEIRLFAVP